MSRTTTSATTTPTITEFDTTDDVLSVAHINTEAGYNSCEASFRVRCYGDLLSGGPITVLPMKTSRSPSVYVTNTRLTLLSVPSLLVYSFSQSSSLFPLFFSLSLLTSHPKTVSTTLYTAHRLTSGHWPVHLDLSDHVAWLLTVDGLTMIQQHGLAEQIYQLAFRRLGKVKFGPIPCYC